MLIITMTPSTPESVMQTSTPKENIFMSTWKKFVFRYMEGMYIEMDVGESYNKHNRFIYLQRNWSSTCTRQCMFESEAHSR